MLTNSSSRARLALMWKLSWPAIIEQILATMVSFVDTAMTGALGATASAAVSINAAPIWLVNGVLSGVGVGYSVQVSHSVGAGDTPQVKRVIRQAVLAAGALGLLFFGVFLALSGVLPRWLRADKALLPDAIRYLRIYSFSLLFSPASIIFSGVLRCMGNTKLPLFFNTGANILNVIFNFFLIYAPRQVTLWGLTLTIPGAGMGVAGAALGTALSWLFAGVVTLGAGLRQGDYAIHRGESFRPDGPVIRQAARLGLPSALERATVNLGQIALTGLVSGLGTVPLAANHVATTAEGLCYLPAFGISYAATAMVGQSIGAKRREDARAYGTLAARLSFFLCAVTGLCLFLFAGPLASLFNSDPLVVDEAARMLRIVSVCEPFFAVSIVLSGALRAARDVRFPMMVSLICMWGVRVLLAPILVHRAGLGLAAVWLAMDADLILRGVLCALRWRRGKWERSAFA